MKTLTIKQPWASLIAMGIKDIENRTWPTKYRGTILIHAGKKPAGSIHGLLTTDQKYCASDQRPHAFVPLFGAIIGSVDIIDCVENHPSVWAERNNPADLPEGMVFIKPVYNWVLENAVLFEEPILNVKGKLSLWDFKLPENDSKVRTFTL